METIRAAQAENLKIPHCWYNEGTEVLRVLVVKVPRPQEQTRLL